MLEQGWCSIEAVLVLCWNRVGTVLEQSWYCNGTALVQCWHCIKAGLVLNPPSLFFSLVAIWPLTAQVWLPVKNFSR